MVVYSITQVKGDEKMLVLANDEAEALEALLDEGGVVEYDVKGEAVFEQIDPSLVEDTDIVLVAPSIDKYDSVVYEGLAEATGLPYELG